MERNYWIHRISHLAEISYPLLDNNYLSYGFSDFENEGFIEGVRGENGWNFMENQFDIEWGERPRTRYQLWNFVHEMKAEDWVIVPTYGEFSICELLDDEPIMIKDIKDFEIKNWNGELIPRDDAGYLVNSENDRIDLGFARRIKMIQKGISRYDFADSNLTSRLKVRQTNVCINDLKDSVQKALDGYREKRPIRFRNELEEVIPNICSIIQTKLNPDKFEYLVTFRTFDKEKFIKKLPNASVMHVKNGCLFSINALNKLIDGLKTNESPNNEYLIDWDEYKDKLIILSGGELSISNLTKIEDKSEFFNYSDIYSK